MPDVCAAFLEKVAAPAGSAVRSASSEAIGSPSGSLTLTVNVTNWFGCAVIAAGQTICGGPFTSFTAMSVRANAVIAFEARKIAV